MIKCPNCGVEIEDRSKFCGECGAAIPQSKECPQCQTKLAFGAKFCIECGYSFMDKQAGGVSIGDKNVIAGDVVAKKEAYHISGNATIVENDDESRKLVRCSLCGKNIAVSNSIECKSCGGIVCEDCFDEEHGICTKCVKEGKDAASKEYREAVSRIIKNGCISIDDRKKLIALQTKLGLNASRAMEIESQMKPQIGVGVLTENAQAFDKAIREKAFDLFYNKGDYKKTAEILSPLFSTATDNEELIAMYVGALSKYNPPAARRVIASLKADVLSAYMARFEMDLKNGDLAAAEKCLDKADEFWPNNLIVACHRAIFLCEMARVSDDKTLISTAKKVLAGVPKAADNIEKSWLAYANNMVCCAEGNATNVDWAEICEKDGLLLDIVTQGENKSNLMYCIVDISGGAKAKKYPVYYMNTESTVHWDDEFKTCLVPFRRIEPGTYTIGHGAPYLPSIDEDAFDYKPNNIENRDCLYPEHQVTLTSAYYIAVFPLTTGQLKHIAGDKVRKYLDEWEEEDFDNNPMAPASCLSYVHIRGSKMGLKWPQSKAVDSDSLVAILREKTGLFGVDLPTNAQWEVACRAGTNADLYTGANFGSDSGKNCRLLDELAVWGDGVKQQTVGSRIPNSWGLYDMLGNVGEWCLDPYFGDGPAYGNNPDVRGRMHVYNFPAVDPTGCLTTLLPDDELEKKHRIVRGGYYYHDDPEDISVWHRYSEFPDSSAYGGSGLRLTIHGGNALVDDLMVVLDSEFCPLEEAQIVQLKKASFQGDKKATYLLVRDSEIRNEVQPEVDDPIVQQYKALADFGLPAAMRALGRILIRSNDLTVKKSAINYYRSAIKLGDLYSLSQFKSISKCDQRLVSVVNSLCERNKTPFLGDSDIAFYFGAECDAVNEKIQAIIARDFAWPKQLMSDRLLAILIWNKESVETLSYASMEVISESGIYIVCSGDGHARSGFIPWLDFREFGNVGLVGRAKETLYLQLCENSLVMDDLPRPDKGEENRYNNALVDIYSSMYKAVCELFSECGLVESVNVEDFKNITSEQFDRLLGAASGVDAIAAYQVAQCYQNGWGCKKSLSRALSYYGKASRGGCIEAVSQYRKLARLDDYDRYVLMVALRKAFVQSGMNTTNYWIGDKIKDNLRTRFTDGCRECNLTPIDNKVTLLAACSEDGDEPNYAIFFADDGIYVFNCYDRDDSEISGDGYIAWPDFINKCLSGNKRDGLVVQEGCSVGIDWFCTEKYRKSLIVAIDAIAESVKAIYSESFQDKLFWLRSFREEGKSISDLTTSDIETLATLLEHGCGVAGEVLYNYYSRHNEEGDREKGITALKIASATGYPLARDIYRETLAIDDSMSRRICAAMANAAEAESDARYIIRDRELTPAMLDAFKHKASETKLSGRKYYAPFACIGHNPLKGQGMFFAADGIYCIDEDCDGDNYFITWADASEGVCKDPEGLWNVQIGNPCYGIAFNTENCSFTVEGLTVVLEAAVAAYKKATSKTWQQAQDVFNKIENKNLKVEKLSSDDITALSDALASGFGEAGRILRDYYLAKKDSTKSLVAYQKAIWFGVDDINELIVAASKGKSKLCKEIFDECLNLYEDDLGSIDLASSISEATIKNIRSGIAKWMPEFKWTGKDSLLAIVDQSSWSNSYGKSCDYGLLICQEGLVVSNKNSANSGVVIWDAFAANPPPRLIEEGGENKVLLNVEPKIQYDCQGSFDAESALAFLTKLHIIAKRECGVSTSNEDDSFNVQDICGTHKLEICISKNCLSIGATKFDDEDELDDIDKSDFDDIDDYYASISLPLLDRNSLVALTSNERGKTTEQKFALVVNDQSSGIKYQVDKRFKESSAEFSCFMDERNCKGREVCLCGEKRFEQQFCLEGDHFIEIEGAFNPTKLVVRYVSLLGADGNVENLITGITYNGEECDLEPFGRPKYFSGKSWVENSRGRSQVHPATQFGDGTDVSAGTEEDSSENSSNSANIQKNKDLNPVAIIGAVIGYVVMWAVSGFWYTLLAMAVFIGLSGWMMSDAAEKDHEGIMVVELLGAGAALIWFLWKMIVALFN